MITGTEIKERWGHWFVDDDVWQLPDRCGWNALIDSALHRLESAGIKLKVVRVKQKFGLLRFDVTDVVWGKETTMPRRTIGYLEAASAYVCECCGSMERVTTEGRPYITTLCPPCRLTLNDRRLKLWDDGR